MKPEALGDASLNRDVGGDASPAADVDTSHTCRWCRRPMAQARRPQGGGTARTFCSQKCRQSHWKGFGRYIEPSPEPGALEKRRVARYADPPYPDKAYLYRGHPDYAGEVDHASLLQTVRTGADGWAVSTSRDGLGLLAGIAREQGLVCGRDYRIAIWDRGVRSVCTSWPAQSWEAVLYRPCRLDVRDPAPRDLLTFTPRPRLSDPDRVIGAKPGAFAAWLFELLALRRGDVFEDLFAGSGGMMRAWNVFAGEPEAASADAEGAP